MLDTEKEFVAYSRLLLRELLHIREALNDKDYEEAEISLNQLIEDTKTDIES